MPRPLKTLAILFAIASGGIALAQLEPELERKSKPVIQAKSEPTGQELEKLTENLNSDDFKTRENAQIALAKLALDHPQVTIDTILEKYRDQSILPEERYRLRAILYNSRKALYTNNPPGFVGIVMLPAGNLVRIGNIVPDSAAARDGLLAGDHIASIDGKAFSAESSPTQEFSNYVMSKKSGDQVTLKILRTNVEMEIIITLGRRPDELIDSRFQARFDAQFKLWLDQQTKPLKTK